MKLLSKKAKPLKKKKRDSEGLAFFGDNLLISFERKHRVDLYALDGVKIKKVVIHVDLRDTENYDGENKGLESVTYSKKYGVITAPEIPLITANNPNHTIYAKNKTWSFKSRGNITSIEFMNEDDVMILLREFNYFTRNRVSYLVRLNLASCENSFCKSQVLATMDSSKGWVVDNFEGLTKLYDNLYLMVSDDNSSIFQKTLFVLFEVKN